MSYTKQNKLPMVTIFGRTNVGKSTLFNCLIEKNQALVSDIEGTTRDANINEVEWQGRKFELVDTGGIMDLKYLGRKKVKADSIDAEVQAQARAYLKQANLILFLVDNKTGLLPTDKQMALFLKKSHILKDKILLIANKVDNIKHRPRMAEFHKLALGEPIPVSAANGSGTGDMLDIVLKKLKIRKSSKSLPPACAGMAQAGKKTEEEPEPPIKVSIIGKPHVGKSSLLNSLLGYKRVIVSDKPHTTREPQNTDIIYKGNTITLIDTAGISKKGKQAKGLEKDGIVKSLQTLKKSDIALLVIDLKAGITHQDQKLVEEIVDRRISFMIIANKWDLIKERDTKKYTRDIYADFPFATWAPLHFTSALTGSKVPKVLDQILELADQRKIEIGDSVLNKFLVKIVKKHRPTKSKGTKHPRIYELKQIKANPPKFTIRIGPKDTLHKSYARFIENRLRDKFGFLGAPISMSIIKKSQALK